MKRYLSAILLVQIVATYLVILGHSFPFTVNVPHWLTRSQVFLYTFHMPLFVWISGYLLVYTQQINKSGYKNFVKKRFIKLLLPYFVLSLLAIIPKFYLQQYLNDSLTLDSYSILETFFAPRFNIWGHFWFLPMIFIEGGVGYIIDSWFSKLRIRKIGWLTVTIILFIIYCCYYQKNITQWMSLNDLITFSWLFAAGCLGGCFMLIDKMTHFNSLLWVILSFILALLLFYLKVPYIMAPIMNGLIAILMIFALLDLCIILAGIINVNKNALYAQTFVIFLLSWPCQVVANILTERILNWPYYLIMPIQFVFGLVGPILMILLIDKIEKRYSIHWISFILGKYKHE